MGECDVDVGCLYEQQEHNGSTTSNTTIALNVNYDWLDRGQSKSLSTNILVDLGRFPIEKRIRVLDPTPTPIDG